MLTVSTPRLLQPSIDLVLSSSAQELHSLSFWPVYGTPENTMLNNNFQELPHFPESFFQGSFSYPCQRETPSQCSVLTCCDSEKRRYPVIQNKNIFINGPILEAMQYTSHNFQPQKRNIEYNNNTSPSVGSSFRNHRHRLESFVSLVSRRKDTASLSVQNVSCDNKTSAKMKDVLSMRVGVGTYGQDNCACSLLNINVKIENERNRGVNLKNAESNTTWRHYLPPDRNKLGHSIASILNISPENGNCMDSEVLIENNESDKSNCVDDIDDDDSSGATSDVLVDDDDDVTGSSRSGEDEISQEKLTGDKFNSIRCLPDIVNECSKIAHSRDTSEPVKLDDTHKSANSTLFSKPSCRNTMHDYQDNSLTDVVLLTSRKNGDCFQENNTLSTHNNSFTCLSLEVKGQTAQRINKTPETNNKNSNKKVSACFSQINPKVTNLASKNDSIFKAQSAAGSSKETASSASTSNALPPIQTLCQPYHKLETNERSAFKPIRKTPSTFQQLPTSHYHNWAERINLYPNTHSSNRTMHAHSPIIQPNCSEAFTSRQNRNDSVTNKIKDQGIGILRQKSSFYQSQCIPDIFLPTSASLATKLLPNTLETWMSWLRQRDVTPVKSNKCEDGTTSRSSAPPRYHCEACSKTYSTFGGFSKHRQFHCTQHIKKEFVCKVCSRAYSSLGALKMHIRTHTLPCRCHECGKAFSRPWLLQGHLRTHTGEKPFKCNHCGRAFADRSNLRAHLQTHAEIKRYACGKCGKTFSRMSLLTKHAEVSCPVILKNK